MALRQTRHEVTKAQDFSGQWSVDSGNIRENSALDERLLPSSEHWLLFPAGMSLALPGEQIVGPGSLVGWCD